MKLLKILSIAIMAAIASAFAGCSDVEDIVDLNPYRMIVSEVKVSDITSNSAVVTIYVQNPDAVRRILKSNRKISIEYKSQFSNSWSWQSCDVEYVDAVAVIRADFKYKNIYNVDKGILDPKTKYEVRLDNSLIIKDEGFGTYITIHDLNPEILTSFTTL